MRNAELIFAQKLHTRMCHVCELSERAFLLLLHSNPSEFAGTISQIRDRIKTIHVAEDF